MPTPKLPELDTSRGSPTGRSPWPRKTPYSEGLDITQTACFKSPAHCFRVHLIQGYDSGGAYWGGPNNLWCATNGFDGGETFQMFTRAPSRAEAQDKFESEAPGLITWHKRSPRNRRSYERR